MPRYKLRRTVYLTIEHIPIEQLMLEMPRERSGS